jgi:5-methylcytosine-specific restriction endonuclease McrA
MKLEEMFQEMKNRGSTEELVKKRFACANCGITWIELVGLIVGHRDGKEDLYLRIGMESETCQVCRMKARECQECGSKDVYELRFAEEISEEVPLSFKGMKIVHRE